MTPTDDDNTDAATDWDESAYPPEALRFYFGDRNRPEDPATLESFVAVLTEREWLIEPPTLVERGRVELRTYRFQSPRRHEDRQEELRALEDVRWLADQLADLTRRLGRENELAIDEESMGSVVKGQIDPDLAAFLSRWERALADADASKRKREAAAIAKRPQVWLWIGDLASDLELTEYLTAHPEGDGERSWFASELRTWDHVDDALEAWWESPRPVAELLRGLSFGASFVPAAMASATQLGVAQASTMIALFDPEPTIEPPASLARGRMRLVGTFHYDPSAAATGTVSPHRRDRRQRITRSARSRFGELVDRAPVLAMSVVRSVVSPSDVDDRDVPRAAATVAFTLLADSEIRNGGVSQLLYNHGTEQARRMADALREVGALRAAFVVESAIDRAGDADPRSASLHDLDLQYYEHDPSVRAVVADFLSRCTEPWFDDLAVDRDVRERLATVTVQDTLRQAIELGHPGRVRAALAAGASPAAPSAGGEPPLVLALGQIDEPSRVEVVAALLDAGASHTDDARSVHPLAFAASTDRPAFVRLLLDRGASPTLDDDVGVTALHHAWGAAVSELLLAAGADARATAADGRSVLHRVRDIDQLRVLLDAGADPLALTTRGESSLHQPLDEEGVRLLLELGVAADHADVDGRTPLMCQAWPGAMTVLLDAGARVDAADLKERTTLHQHHSDGCTELLLARGADPLRKDAEGKSSLDDARAHDYYRGRYIALLERAAGVARPAIPAAPPPPPVAPRVPPMLTLASALLERLIGDELIELAENADRERLADELAELLGGLHLRRDPGGDLSRWLVDRADVAEVFATDDALLAALKESTGP